MLGNALFTLRGILGLDSREFDQGIDQAEERGRGFGETMGGVAKTIAGAATAIGVAVKGIGIAAMKVGGDWESSMNAIQAQTGMSADELRTLEMAFRDMALEGNFSGQEIAKAFGGIAVAGQDSAHGIEVMESAMTLAAATGESLGSAAYFLGNYLLKVGRDSSYADKYIDLFAQGVRNTGIGLSDLQNYVFRMTPAFQAFGAESETNIAILTRLYQAGIRGANLYSGMGTIMMQAATGVGNFAEMLHYASMDTEVMNRLSFEFYTGMVLNEAQLFEVARAMNEYEDSTRLAGVVADALTQTQQAAWFEFMNLAESIQNEVIPSFDAYGVALEMANTNNIGFGTSLGALRSAGNDALLTIFEVINAPISAALETAAGKAGEFALRLREGGDLHPYVVRLGEVISDLVERVVGLATAIIPIVVEWLPTLAEWLAKGIDLVTRFAPQIAAVYGAFKAWKVIKTVTGIVGGLKIGLGKLNVTMGKTKVASAAMVGKKGLAAIGGAASTALSGINGLIGKGVAGAAAGGKGLLGAGKTLLKFTGPKGWAVLAGGALLGFLTQNETVREGLGKAWNTIREGAGNLMEGIRERFGQMRENAAEMVENFKGGFNSRREAGYGVVRSFAGGVLDVFTERFPRISEIAGTLVTDFRDGFNQRREEGYGVIRSFAGGALDTFASGLQGVREIGQSVVDGFNEGFNSRREQGYGVIRSFAGGVIDAARGIFASNSPSQVFANIGGGLVEGMWQGMQQAEGSFSGRVRGFFSNIVNTAKGALGISSPSIRAALEIGRPFVQGVKMGIDSNVNLALKSAESMSENILSHAADWIGPYSKTIGALASKAKSTIEGALGHISAPGVALNYNTGLISPALTQQSRQSQPVEIKIYNTWYVEDEVDIDLINRKQAQRLQDTMRGAGFAEVSG